MKLGSKYNLLNTPAQTEIQTDLLQQISTKWVKDPMEALGRIDFTKYAVSTIIYSDQLSENG